MRVEFIEDAPLDKDGMRWFAVILGGEEVGHVWTSPDVVGELRAAIPHPGEGNTSLGVTGLDPSFRLHGPCLRCKGVRSWKLVFTEISLAGEARTRNRFCCGGCGNMVWLSTEEALRINEESATHG